MFIAACACATVTPSRRRAFTKKAASSGRRSSVRGGAPRAGSDEIGSQKSVTMPMLIVPSVTCRANADDRDRHALDPDGAADHGRIRTELPRPGLVPDDGHHRGAGRVLRRVEPAPERRPESQHGQIRRRGVFGDRRPQRALVQVVHAAWDERGGRAREDVGVRRHVQVGRVRVPIHAPGVGGVLIDVDETVGIGKRLLAEERRVDEAEDGGIGADAEAENEDGGGREAPVAGEAPDRVAGVAHERVDGARASSVPAHFLDLLDAAERAQRLVPRGLGRQAARSQPLGFAVDVQLQLFVQLRFASIAEDERPHAASQDVPEPHGL